MFKKIFRGIFTLCGGLLGYGASFLLINLIHSERLSEYFMLTRLQERIFSSLVVTLCALIFFIIAPSITRGSQKVAKGIEMDLQKVPATDLIPGIFGLVIGLFIALIISQLYTGIPLPYVGTILSLLTYLFLGYLGVFVATRRGKDILAFRSGVQKGGVKPKGKGGDVSPKILDTSVIIDGRIADILKTGFIEGNIVIPEFVLVELRHIADSSDGLKRNRGRRGLDILNRIQTDYGIDIYNTVAEKALEEIPEVDVKLLKLAQMMNGKVVTNDFNLNKVALIKGVEVLNINELANTLKPVVLPGEDMQLFLIKEGKENGQAVAYLDDGTMIVVEDGKRHIGETITAEVTSVLQTSAGRMIFAKPKRDRR
ncbi:MAG: PIN/TRAM domain-containing protein [Anaerovoracaceae bacterium]